MDGIGASTPACVGSIPAGGSSVQQFVTFIINEHRIKMYTLRQTSAHERKRSSKDFSLGL